MENMITKMFEPYELEEIESENLSSKDLIEI